LTFKSVNDARDARFGSLADKTASIVYVRFTPVNSTDQRNTF